jgi:hypothetical protein
MQKVDFTPQTYAMIPDSDPTGSLQPVGDAVIPMLLMVGLYLCVRIFKSRKKLNLDKV